MAALTFDDLTSAPAGSPAQTGGPLTFDDITSGDARPLTITPGATPQDAAGGDQSAAVGQGLINGVPIVGPYMLGGLNRVAAGVRALQHGTSYGDELQNVEKFGQSTAANNPGSDTAGQMAGAVLGSAAMLPEATGGLGYRVLAGAASNAGIGAADSAVRGQDPLTGAVVGGLGGAAGPVIGAGVGAGVRAVAGLRAPVPQALQGVGRIGQRMMLGDLGGMTPAEYTAQQGRIGDLGFFGDLTPGATTTAQGIAVGNDAARQAIRGPYQARSDGTNARVIQGVTGLLGPDVSRDSQLLALDQQAAPYAAAQQQALRAPGAQPLSVTMAMQNVRSGLAEAAPGSPEADALNDARRMMTAGQTPAVEGAPAQRVPVTDPKTGRVIRYQPVPAVEPAPATPNPISDPAQVYSARRAVDLTMKYGRPGDLRPSQAVSVPNGAYAGVRSELDSALRTVPGYGDATDALRGINLQKGAVDLGYDSLRNPQMHPQDLARLYGALPPSAQANVAGGQAAAMHLALGNKANDLQAAIGMLNGKDDGGAGARKLAVAFGQQPVDDLQGVLKQNQLYRDQNGIVQGGSQTASNLEANAKVNPDLSKGLAGIAKRLHIDAPLSPIIGMAERGQQALYGNARSQVAPLYTSAGSTRDALVQALMQLRDARATAGQGAAARVSPLVAALIAASAQGGRQVLQGQ